MDNPPPERPAPASRPRDVRATAAGDRCRGCGKLQVRMETTGMGRVVEVPAPCRCAFWRRVNCICRVCDHAVVGKPRVALYCAEHRAAARAASVARHRAKVGEKHQRAYYARNADRKRAQARAYYQSSAERRARKNAGKAEWRRRNPDKVRAQKARYELRHWKEDDSYMARYRAEVAAGERTPAPLPRNDRGERTCLRCPTPLAGRAKICAACRRGDT
ncbi:MAG: hypothetical protein JWM27_4712 [Gemmatimonadetes bacterium]|nr:hypothetical protein [Gemmatimonadota bacterium]